MVGVGVRLRLWLCVAVQMAVLVPEDDAVRVRDIEGERERGVPVLLVGLGVREGLALALRVDVALLEGEGASEGVAVSVADGRRDAVRLKVLLGVWDKVSVPEWVGAQVAVLLRDGLRVKEWLPELQEALQVCVDDGLRESETVDAERLRVSVPDRDALRDVEGLWDPEAEAVAVAEAVTLRAVGVWVLMVSVGGVAEAVCVAVGARLRVWERERETEGVTLEVTARDCVRVSDSVWTTEQDRERVSEKVMVALAVGGRVGVRLTEPDAVDAVVDADAEREAVGLSERENVIPSDAERETVLERVLAVGVGTAVAVVEREHVDETVAVEEPVGESVSLDAV